MYRGNKFEIHRRSMCGTCSTSKLILDGSPQGDQWIRAYEYALAQLHMIASIFVGHVYYWGDVHVKNFGEVRGNYISPARDAMDLGVSVNFHQDTPVTKPNMMHTVWCAAYQYGEEASKQSPILREDKESIFLTGFPFLGHHDHIE